MSTVEKPAYKVIGTRPIRHDGEDKVTGAAKYGGDVQLEGMLYAAILRSPHAHAKITRIDTTQAEALPGVRAVMTSANMPDPGDRMVDLGEGTINLRHLSERVLARAKVLFKGHPVAAVAADSIHIAEEALELINVQYEALPAVLDVREAMRQDALILNDDVRTEEVGTQDGVADKPTNVAKRFLFEKGDPKKGFAEAELVVEREFETATVHQGYIEPHNATAQWHENGQLTVWTSTQGAFTVRQQIGELLGIPLDKIKVIPMEIGGGFGGKIAVYLQPLATELSRMSGRPVQLVMDRAAIFEATGPTPGSYMRVKLGATRDGRLLAGDAYVAFEAGAYPGSPVGAGCMCVFACYDIPHARIEGFDVCVNKPRTSAYRAPGSTQVAFAVETIVDEIARQLEMDPADFRLQNAAREGTRRVDGPVFDRIGMIETVEAIKASDHYQSPLDGPNQGRGIATGFWFNAGLRSAVTATVNPDGTVSLVEGSTDIGGTRTSLAMQLAEALNITAEQVAPSVADTDGVGLTDVTGGSRVTFATGIAVVDAAAKIRQQMVDRAAKIWECDADSVSYEDGQLVGPDQQRLSFKEMAQRMAEMGGPIIANGICTEAKQAGAYATHCVDVEVDPETGKVQILRYTAAQDVGTAIHPSYVEGQMQGGVVQGIGWALNEEYYYDDQGQMRNPTFLDYRMPTSYDVPMIDTIIVEVPDPNHPYGVRGVGEVPICPPPAAVANAIHDAIGVRMHRLPMSPPRLMAEILRCRGNKD